MATKIISVNYKPLRDAVSVKKEEWGNLRALGSQIGVSYSALSRFLMSGAEPSIINLLRLCDYTGIAVADLVEREQPAKARGGRKVPAREARP